MKKLITNWRYWAAGVIACIGLVLLVSEPTATEVSLWFTTLAISKAVGIALCAISLTLFTRWAKAGKIDLTDILNEE